MLHLQKWMVFPYASSPGHICPFLAGLANGLAFHHRRSEIQVAGIGQPVWGSGCAICFLLHLPYGGSWVV